MAFREGQLGLSRRLAIFFLIASLIHIPLPQPDFHNIRHHDGPGEVCDYHDHLLRWHPSAGQDVDVSMLHWHWILPFMDGSSRHDESSDDSQHRRRDLGPAFHASVGDGLEPDLSSVHWLSAEAASGSLSKQFTVKNLLSIADTAELLTFLRAPIVVRPFATFAPPSAQSPSCPGLQRWNC